MSAPSMPQVPPRPARSEKGSSGATLGSDIPKIPPRPTGRKIDRSPSPSRESFARSPLNESPYMQNHGNPSRTSLYSSGSANASQSDLPQRPSSVVLPSLGQEGSEYAEVFNADEELGSSPTQTRNIANDLHLHAPKPSLPTQTAKRRVSGVTRTDSNQAAALGIGKSTGNYEDKDPRSHIKTEDSYTSQNGIERPASSMDEHGIPEIGQRVPMYPNAGDVQAPSPALNSTPYVPGIGFHNDGTKPRHHGRRISARGTEQPPGSYGLHGHGVIPHDRFEKAYYEKHPELLHKETGHYSGALAEKAQWAMSSEDLNRIVRDTASRGAGLGTSPAIMGTPSEQIGFQASEEYTSRMASPRPESASYHKKALSSSSQTHVDSPLRKSDLPAEGLPKEEFENTLGRSLQAPSDTAFDESEVEDENTIHVDAPSKRISKIYGGASQSASVDDLGYHTPGNEEDYVEEHGYSAPILASDEVAKEPYGYELQPAVSPQHHRSGSSLEHEGHHFRSASATSSRPTSIHGVPGLRMTDYDREAHSTPLEDLEEYEPLFPEDEKKPESKPATVVDKLKRPDHRKFPSQDVWEDTPNSLQYTATVSTPQLPDEPSEETQHLRKFKVREGENPGQAFARRQEELAEAEHIDHGSFLSREKRPNAYGTHQNSSHSGLSKEVKAEAKQARFPSRDVWEDTPDSLQLQTTVSGPQVSEVETPILSPPGPEPRPTTGAVVYHHEKDAAGIEMGGDEGRATTGIAAVIKPSIPARPSRSKPDTSAKPAPPLASKPTIPERPKPQIPARPAKAEGAPLTKSTSASSAKSNDSLGDAAASKPKPPVPSRPVGSKIAALQSGFMSDLNKRLQLGPQAPKKEEVKEEEAEELKEKAPLADARKGRARGPQRRAPAAAAAAAVPAASSADKAAPTLSFSTPSTLWHIHPEDGNLNVASHEVEASVPAPAPIEPVENKATQSATPTLATNTAGDSVHEPAEIADNAAQPTIASPLADTHAREAEETAKDEVIQAASTPGAEIPVKDSNNPVVTSEEDLTASTGTLKAEAPVKDEISTEEASPAAAIEKEEQEVREVEHSIPGSFE